MKDSVSHSRSHWLCGGSDRVWTLRPHHCLSSWAPWLGRRYQQEPQKHHPDVTDRSGASGFVSRSQQGAKKLLSAPNSHERKTKFHHNVDHLWMRMIFQERPLEKGTRKIKTIVLREHDLKGSTGSTKQIVYGVVLRCPTFPDFWLLSNFKLFLKNILLC